MFSANDASGIDDITIIFNNDFLNDQLIDQICNEIQATINPDQLEWIDDYTIIMIVGEGMKKTHGVSRQILDSLDEQGNFSTHDQSRCIPNLNDDRYQKRKSR